jgi:hypothetical protein
MNQGDAAILAKGCENTYLDIVHLAHAAQYLGFLLAPVAIEAS